jgi:hypothetical protein
LNPLALQLPVSRHLATRHVVFHGLGTHRPGAELVLMPIKNAEQRRLSENVHPPDANYLTLGGGVANFNPTGDLNSLAAAPCSAFWYVGLGILRL